MGILCFCTYIIILMAGKRRNHILWSISCLVLLLGSSYSQTDKLLQGQQLKDGDQLVSAFGYFRLGFFSPEGQTNRYLGIWYYTPKDRRPPQFNCRDCDRDYDSFHYALNNLIQPVWVANRNNPILDKSGRLTIDGTDGKLKILHNGGDPIVISLIQAAGNTSATLEKSGNFVLYEMNSNGSRREIWQSFDYPTDTLLPGMKLGINSQTGHKWFLQSWVSDHSPANGSFTLGLHPNVSKKLVIWSSIVGGIIWESGLWQLNGSFQSSNSSYVFYNFSYTSNEQETCFNYSVNEDVTSFPALKIDKNGKLQTEGDIIGSSSIVSCSVFGGCKEYIWGDPVFEAEEKGLWPRQRLFIIILVATMVTLSWLLGCLLWRGKCKPNENWWQSVGVALVIPLLCYYSYLILRKLKIKVESKWNRWKLLRELRDHVSESPPTTFGERKDQSSKNGQKIFDFQIIAAATNNFSTTNKIGQGGFGPVYKGTLPDGQEIAIKALSKSSGQGIVEFKNEAKLIAKLQHTNLVRLLGYSLHGGERILVYEYMPNKSLDFFLFDSERMKLLNLKKRVKIIEGIAQGLVYLHKYSRLKVVHRDLKASNILLNDQMNPKISDFGMAKAFGMNELEANTKRIVGTHGYMSPEYVMNGIVSMKTDVYSFGVMVLEIMSSKKNHGCYDTERPLNLVGYAWQLWNEGRGLELIDQTMDESCSANEVLRSLHMGLLCVQDRATDRPTMSEVVSMLTNETLLLPAPKQPAFFIKSSSEEPEVPEIKVENCSANNVTISEMEGR